MKAILTLLFITVLRQYYSIIFKGDNNDLEEKMAENFAISNRYEQLKKNTNVKLNEANSYGFKEDTNNQIREHLSYRDDIITKLKSLQIKNKDLEDRAKRIISVLNNELKDLIKILINIWMKIIELNKDKDYNYISLINISDEYFSSFINIIKIENAQSNENIDLLKSLTDKLKDIVSNAMKNTNTKDKDTINKLQKILNNLIELIKMIQNKKAEINTLVKLPQKVSLTIEEIKSANKKLITFIGDLDKSLIQHKNKKESAAVLNKEISEVYEKLKKDIGKYNEEEIGENSHPLDVKKKLAIFNFFYDTIYNYFDNYKNITSYFGYINEEDYAEIKIMIMNDLTNFLRVMTFVFNAEKFTEDEKKSKFILIYTIIFDTLNEMQNINMKNNDKKVSYDISKLKAMKSLLIISSTKSTYYFHPFNNSLSLELEEKIKDLKKTIDDLNKLTSTNNTDIYDIFKFDQKISAQGIDLSILNSFHFEYREMISHKSLISNLNLLEQIRNIYTISSDPQNNYFFSLDRIFLIEIMVNFQKKTKDINLLSNKDIEQIKIDYNNVSNLLSDLNNIFEYINQKDDVQDKFICRCIKNYLEFLQFHLNQELNKIKNSIVTAVKTLSQNIKSPNKK